MTFTLFNLEGTRVKKICRRHIFSVYRGGYADAGQVGKKRMAPTYGPIAQLARAHD